MDLPEFRRLDLNSSEMGVPVARLMANAGKALAKAVAQAADGTEAGLVLFVCGKGNNGGDGAVAARRLLDAGRDVLVAQLEEPPPGPAADARAALPPDRVVAWDRLRPRVWEQAAVVVDCLLGSGLSGRPRAPYDKAIRRINAFDGPVVACDVPSGLGTPVAVRPDVTVTFHAMKEGMDRSNSGRIIVAPIGIPRAAATDVGLGDLSVAYPRAGAGSHKGDNGIVLMVAGGPYHGAPHYAGMGAYRTGADLVLAWMPVEAARVVATWGPDLLVHASNPGDHLTMDGAQRAAGQLSKAGCLLIGPGLGTHDVTREACAWLLEEAAKADVPCVIDADALDAVTPAWLAKHGARTVLTPHAREFKDLAGKEATDAAVTAYAKKHGVTVLRKGAVDLIASPARRKRCRRGHATMTVGGTGDVLAGIVAALMAKGAAPFDAACAGAYLNGCAGEIAFERRSWGATATDVHEAVPAVLARL